MTYNDLQVILDILYNKNKNMNNNMNSNNLFIRTGKPEILPGGYAICDKIKNNNMSIDELINTTSKNNNKNEQEQILQLFHHVHQQQHQ